MPEEKEGLSPGERVGEQIWGTGYGELLRAIMNSYDPGFTEHIIAFFEHTYARPALDIKTRQICTLCGLAAMGLAPEMALHFRGSLNLGWTQREIREAVLLTAFTAGVPKTINAFKVFHDVLAELKLAPETDPAPAREGTRYEKGMKRGTELLGPSFEAVMKSAAEFNPDCARHLAGEVFGVIMRRSRLTDRVRLLIIIAACTVNGNLTLLRILLPGVVKAGVPKEEIAEIIYQMHGYAGWLTVLNAMDVFRGVFGNGGTG
jgi:4-carboxymuconolactone decarboxylase